MVSTTPPNHGTDRGLIYKEHWHAILVHFPISLFGVAFLFQILHLFPHNLTGCFEITTNITLIAGTLAMIPTTLSGWLEWKGRYKGARVLIFQRKITIAFAMIGFSIMLTIWRTAFLPIFEDVPFGLWHWLYLAGNTLLILAATAEGYYGGKLNHR